MRSAVTDLEQMKQDIASETRDEELASAACYEVEAYSKHWPHVFLVNDWDVWNETKRALKLQVIRWLEDEGSAYDFHQIRRGCGLIGFKDQEAATHFERRWRRQTDVTSGTSQDWNPHPLKSTFEPVYLN